MPQDSIPSAPVGKLTPFNGGDVPQAPVGKLVPHQGSFAQRSAPTQGSIDNQIPSASVGKLTPLADSRGPAPAGGSWTFPEEKPSMTPWPQWFQSGLEAANKYAVEPFNKMAEIGSQGYANALQDAFQWAPPEAQGVARGVGGLVGGTMADPRQWPLAAGSFASAPLRAATSGAFAGQMAYGAGSQIQDTIRQWDMLSPEQKAEMVTSGSLQAILTGLTGAHAYSEGVKALEPRLDNRVQSVSPGGTARQPAGQEAPVAQQQQMSLGREGGPKPTIETAAQMGGGAAAQLKATGVSGPDETGAAIPQAPVGQLTPYEPTPLSHRDVPGGETEAERIVRLGAGAREAIPPTPEEIAGQKERAEKQAAEQRLMQQRALSGGGQQVPPRDTMVDKEGQQMTNQPFKLPKGKPEPQRKQQVDINESSLSTRRQMTKQAEERVAAGQQPQQPQPQRPVSQLDKMGEQQRRVADYGPAELSKYSKNRTSDLSVQELLDATVNAKGKPQEQPLDAKAEAIQPTEAAKASGTPADASQPVRQPAAESVRGAEVRDETPPKTPVEAPRSPQDALSLTAGTGTLQDLENRVRRFAGPEKAEEINKLKSAVQSGSKKQGLDFEKSWRQALQSYGRQFMRNKPPGEGGFIGTRDPGEGVVAHVKEYLGDEYERHKIARGLTEGIYDLDSMKQADVLRAVQLLDKSKTSRADRAEIHHWLEDRSLPLNQKQINAYVSEIHPLVKENRRIYEKLSDSGLPVENYVHRIVKKKNSKLEQVLLGRRRYSAGASLTQSASSLKKRTLMALEMPGGGRQVVSKKGYSVTGWLNGKKSDLGSAGVLEAKGGRFVTATTKEIETHTPTRYFKDALITTLMSHVDLKRAERAVDFLEAFKQHPDFEKVAFKIKEGTIPSGWKTSIVPTMRDYAFEPRTKEVLDRYWNRLNKGEPEALEQLNHYLRTSIFFNPLIHIPNIANHWVVEKGAFGFAKSALSGKMLKTGARAIDAVFHQNQDFLDALDAGAPLQSQRFTNREATNLLITKLTKDVVENPTFGEKMAEALGKANPKEVVKYLYDFSGKATWMTNDIAILQATYEHMDANPKLNFKDAVTHVTKHIPNYRLPTRILNSRSLGKLMENQNLTMFGAYHYGALRSYGEMLKEVFSTHVPIAERAKSMDRALMLTIATFALYPALDSAVQKGTGDPNAKVRRAGASTFVDNVTQLAKGKKDIVPVLSATATPAPLIKGVGELAFNRQFMTNKPIRNTKAPAKQQVKDVGKYLLGQTGPTSAVARASDKGVFNWRRFLWSLMGVSVDTPQKGSSSGGIGKIGGLGKL